MELDIDEAVPRTEEPAESRSARKMRLAREYWIEILSVVILSVASLAAA